MVNIAYAFTLQEAYSNALPKLLTDIAATTCIFSWWIWLANSQSFSEENIIDSAAQGIINSTLTVLIGFQTKKYLKKEYHLQDILDEIELDEEKELDSEKEMVESLREDIKNKAKKKDLAVA